MRASVAAPALPIDHRGRHGDEGLGDAVAGTGYRDRWAAHHGRCRRPGGWRLSRRRGQEAEGQAAKARVARTRLARVQPRTPAMTATRKAAIRMRRAPSANGHVDLAAWSTWRAGSPSDQLTIGIEEEFMLLDPRDWSLAFRSDQVIAELPPDLRDRVTPETHAAVMEVTTGVHRRVSDAVAELAELRRRMSRALAGEGLRAAVAGMHPSATWERDRRLVSSALPSHRRVDACARAARADACDACPCRGRDAPCRGQTAEPPSRAPAAAARVVG